MFKVARIDAASSGVVPNLRHEMVQLSDDQRVLIQYCTGENSIEHLVELIRKHVLKGELSIAVNQIPISLEGDNLDKHLPEYVNAQLKGLESAALLVTSN